MKVNCFLLTDDDRAVEEGELIFTTVGNVVGQFDGCWANTDGVREIKIIAPDGSSRSVTEYQTQRWTLDPPAQFVDTAPRLVELREIIATELQSPGYVLVSVTDQGEGLVNPEAVFEPFLTSKSDGLGMGLAISKTIIQNHGGRISARNNEKGGTTFSFRLPH